MATEKLEGEIRREQIVEAALALLGTGSVGQLSMADIARRVGLVPSAIYRHFDGRDAVLDAVVEMVERRLQANLRWAREQPGTAIDRLRGLLMRHVRFVRENQGVPRVMFSDEIVDRSPARRARTWGILRDYLAGVAELVRQGQGAGEIRSDLDAGTAAMLFLGIVQPGALLWHLSGGRFDITRHARRAWKPFREWLAGGRN
jgi:AcrR family transcriptional regulator